MAKNKKLIAAKSAKNDEFYTQYSDIEKEINAYIDYNPNVFKDKTILLPADDPEWSNFTKYFAANFERFGLKKLISTSYAESSGNEQISLFEQESPIFDEDKHKTHGKIFTLDRDTNKSGKIDLDDLQFQYLKENGDFRSAEVKKLRDEADIIITNRPFSLFREFLQWIMEAKKQFLIIGNINCITYKEVFALIKANKIWLGTGMGRWISGFIVPEKYELYGTEAKINSRGQRIVSTNNCLWLTNLEHGKRHETMPLMSMADNLKFNKKLTNRLKKNFGKFMYPKYDNYPALEVPYTEAIPSDYTGIMGVPITFLDKFNPDQFEILGITDRQNSSGLRTKKYTEEDTPKFNDLNAGCVVKLDNGKYKQIYVRLLIKNRKPTGEN